MTLPNILRLFVLGLIVIAIAHCQVARADDDCRGHSCNGGGDTTVGVDTDVTTGPVSVVSSFGGSPVSISDSSKSYGLSGSDYDIGNGTCRVHGGGFTVAIPVIDEFCQGVSLIDRGMVKAGVRHICTQSKIGKNYDNFEDCRDEMSEVFGGVTPPPVAEERHDEEDEELQYQRELIEDQQVLLMDMRAKIENLEKQKSRPAGPSEFEKRAAAARAVLQGEVK